jgi:uncharacterized protein (UPF0276 family)
MSRVAVGIGLRDPHIEPLMALTDRSVIDVLEVMIDEALEPGPKRDAWRRLGARWPLIAHGTELGICDAAGPDPHYLEHIFETAKALYVHWYSEHLSFLRGGDVSLGHFAPMFDDEDSYATLAQSGEAVRAGLPCPLLLENPADILGAGADHPQAGAKLGRHFRRALQAADCGALLDLTNLVYNARNDHYEPQAFIDALDLDRVVEIHLAGGRQVDGLWLDSHDQAVDADALALLEEVARRAPQLRAVIVERDGRIPALPVLLAELDQVRLSLQRAGRA